jgi:hypothetical protein
LRVGARKRLETRLCHEKVPRDARKLSFSTNGAGVHHRWPRTCASDGMRDIKAADRKYGIYTHFRRQLKIRSHFLTLWPNRSPKNVLHTGVLASARTSRRTTRPFDLRYGPWMVDWSQYLTNWKAGRTVFKKIEELPLLAFRAKSVRSGCEQFCPAHVTLRGRLVKMILMTADLLESSCLLAGDVVGLLGWSPSAQAANHPENSQNPSKWL